jgi:hypothetical protein
MLCYKDKTYCNAWKECAKGKECDSALTEEVVEEAKYLNLDISCCEKFDCFEEKQ